MPSDAPAHRTRSRLANGVLLIAAISLVASLGAAPTGPVETALAAPVEAPAAQSQTLRYYLQSTPSQATAGGGYSMTTTQPSGQAVTLDPQQASSWLSDPPLNGTMGTGSSFTLRLPCPQDLSVARTVRLESTAPDGTQPLLISTAQSPNLQCGGEYETIRLLVMRPYVILIRKRLKVTVTSQLTTPISLPLGSNAYLELTGFQSNDPTPTPAPQPGVILRTLDSIESVGTYSSLALNGANPVISYQDSTNADLRLAVCTDPTCAAPPIRRTLDTGGNVGNYTSLALYRENPVITYHAFAGQLETLKLAICSDSTCATAPTIRTLASFPSVSAASSLALNGGNPVVSFWDTTVRHLKLAVCNDPTCTAPTIRTLDSSGNTGIRNSLKINGGNPVVSYIDATNDLLKVASCSDPTCAAPPTIRTIGGAYFTESIVLALNGGNPVIARSNGSPAVVTLTACSDPTCTATPTMHAVDSASRTANGLSLALSGGNPVMSYFDSSTLNTTGGDLRVAICSDPTCAAAPTIRYPEAASNTDGWTTTSVAINGSNPVVSYDDGANRDLKIAICLNATCAP